MISISNELYIEHLGVAGALAISVFVLVGLIFRLRDTQDHPMFIWAMIVFFSVNISDTLNSLAFSDTFEAPSWLYRWNDVIIPEYMVSLFFYVRALTSPKPGITKRDMVHVIPFVIALLCLAPALILPGDVRRGIAEGNVSEFHQWLIDTGETCFWIFWVLLLTFYGTLCILRLIRHKRNIRRVFSDLDGKSLRWLDFLVLTILVLALIVIVEESRILLGYDSLRDGIYSAAYDITLPFMFGFFALRANPVLPEWTETLIAPSTDRPSQTTPPSDTQGRYARSGLTASDMSRFASRLEKRMSEDKIWRDHDINLRSLASAIAISPIHLSEVLNTKLGMSFYDYVNQCRIREACDLLINSDQSVLEISETVGFNSKSTFNTSFKKITEQTPSQWRVRHRP